MKKIILIFIFFFLTNAIFGFDIESIGATGGVMYMRNSSSNGAPSPILPYLGASATFGFTETIFFEPALTVTGSYFLWDEDAAIALPAEIEYADSVFILAFILDLPVTKKFEISENLLAGVFGAPVLMIRLPLKTWGEGENQKSDMVSYFYSSGRFLFFELGGSLDWFFSPKKSFRAALHFLYPLYHLWDGGDATDSITVKLSCTFSFLFKERQPKNDVEAAAAKTDKNIEQTEN